MQCDVRDISLNALGWQTSMRRDIGWRLWTLHILLNTCIYFTSDNLFLASLKHAFQWNGRLGNRSFCDFFSVPWKIPLKSFKTKQKQTSNAKLLATLWVCESDYLNNTSQQVGCFWVRKATEGRTIHFWKNRSRHKTYSRRYSCETVKDP